MDRYIERYMDTYIHGEIHHTYIDTHTYTWIYTYKYIYIFTLRNQLIWFWRLGSPMIYRLQAGEEGEPGGKPQSEGRRRLSPLKHSVKKTESSLSFCSSPPFFSTGALTDRMRTIHTGEGALLYSGAWFQCESLPEIMFPELLCPKKRTHTTDHPRAFQALPHLWCVLSPLLMEQHNRTTFAPTPPYSPLTLAHIAQRHQPTSCWAFLWKPWKVLSETIRDKSHLLPVRMYDPGQDRRSSEVRYLLNRWASFSHLTSKQMGVGWKEDKPHPVPAPAFYSCASHRPQPGPDSCSTTFPSTLCSTATSEPLRMSKFKDSELSPSSLHVAGPPCHLDIWLGKGDLSRRLTPEPTWVWFCVNLAGPLSPDNSWSNIIWNLFVRVLLDETDI